MTQVESFVFVSYTGADEGWATWVASVLEGAGMAARIQVWDSPPGQDFVEWMNVQLTNARWTVALYSKAYFDSHWCSREWTAALARKTLLPLRLEPVAPPETLQTLTWVDLFGIDEDQARERLLYAVGARGLPRLARFPGRPSTPPTPPMFPDSLTAQTSLALSPGLGEPPQAPIRNPAQPSDPSKTSAYEWTQTRLETIQDQFLYLLTYAEVAEEHINKIMHDVSEQAVQAMGVYGYDSSGLRVIEIELRIDWELSAELALITPTITGGLAGWDGKQTPETRVAGRRFANAARALGISTNIWIFFVRKMARGNLNVSSKTPAWKSPPDAADVTFLDLPEVKVFIRRASS